MEGNYHCLLPDADLQTLLHNIHNLGFHFNYGTHEACLIQVTAVHESN